MAFLLYKKSADTDIPLNHSWSLTRKQIQVHTHPTRTHTRLQMEADSMLWGEWLQMRNTWASLCVTAFTCSRDLRTSGPTQGVCWVWEISRGVSTRWREESFESRRQLKQLYSMKNLGGCGFVRFQFLRWSSDASGRKQKWYCMPALSSTIFIHLNSLDPRRD